MIILKVPPLIRCSLIIHRHMQVMLRILSRGTSACHQFYSDIHLGALLSSITLQIWEMNYIMVNSYASGSIIFLKYSFLTLISNTYSSTSTEYGFSNMWKNRKIYHSVIDAYLISTFISGFEWYGGLYWWITRHKWKFV